MNDLRVRRRTVEVMGTVVSLALRGRHASGPAADLAWSGVVASLQEVDRMFSTYRPDSLINRWGRGEVALADAPAALGEVLTLAEEARLASGGAFDIAAVRSPYGGGPDPSGVVKGWAVQRASRLLDALDRTDSCLSAGGDMVCRVRRPDGAAWQIGVEDPNDTTRLIATVPVRDGAVATSGSAHRGAHIVDPLTRAAAGGILQVTVIGHELIGVDIDATTAFVLGDDADDWLAARGRTALIVRADGAVRLLGPTLTSPH